MSSRTIPTRSTTASTTLLAKRVIGMVSGIDGLLLRLPFGGHGVRNGPRGIATIRPDGVLIGLPSSVTAKPPSASMTPAAA